MVSSFTTAVAQAFPSVSPAQRLSHFWGQCWRCLSRPCQCGVG